MDISGNDNKKLHPLNILLILVTFEVSHFDISGKDFNELHPLNILLILVTSEVFQSDISGIDINNLHPEKIYFISVILIFILFNNDIFFLNKLKQLFCIELNEKDEDDELSFLILEDEEQELIFHQLRKDNPGKTLHLDNLI